MKNIAEANRYLENAKELLREKAIKKDGYYQDKKYGKLAGHASYNCVLEALDGLFGIKKKGRKSVDWYQAELAKADKKILNKFGTAYEVLHLVMGYDGHTNAKIAAEGLEEDETIIDWVEEKLTKPSPNPQSPIPNPQSPIPNPQSPIPNPQSPVPSPQPPIS